MMSLKKCIFFLVTDEFAYIAKKARDPNASGYREITRINGGELIKELK